jgi:transcriptional regulator with XRE-family HTH domain
MATIAIKRLLTRLKQLRAAHGLSQERFAELSGISYKYYQAVEAGRKPDLRLSTLQRLASAYRIEVWQLLAPVQPPSKAPKKRPARPRQAGN